MAPDAVGSGGRAAFALLRSPCGLPYRERRSRSWRYSPGGSGRGAGAGLVRSLGPCGAGPVAGTVRGGAHALVCLSPSAPGIRCEPGRLAQRESASFTPRRSLVRSQYRPPGCPLCEPMRFTGTASRLRLADQARPRRPAGCRGCVAPSVSRRLDVVPVGLGPAVECRGFSPLRVTRGQGSQASDRPQPRGSGSG